MAGVLGLLVGCASKPPVAPAVGPGMPPGAAPGMVSAAAPSGVIPAAAISPSDQPGNVVPAGPTPYDPNAPATVPLPVTPPAVPASPTVVAPAGMKPRDDDGTDWAKLPENAWKGVKNAFGYGPSEQLARARFQEGEALFRLKQYAEAAPKFYEASWRWPDSSLEEDAMFLLGESYFFADQYGKAHDAYANLLKKRGNTRYLDTVMSREFAIGRYWDEMDQARPHWPTTPNMTDKTRPAFDTFGNALAAYEMVRLHDPTGPLADASIMATATAYFRKERWEDAAYHFDLIRKEYPKSPFQIKAHVLGLQSKLRVYQGAMYDDKPLREAEEIAKQAVRQFHGRMGEEETRVQETLARIQLQKAEREWAWAKYYETKRYYGAARLHYQALLDNYPRTQIAEEARARLEQIRNNPDSPPDHFRWLSKALSREDVR